MTEARRARAITAVALGATVVAYALLAYHRRWIADDGLIVVRTVREILAGNGPVYSTFERAEANTSAAWTWLVAGVAWATGADVVRTAVVLGGACAASGLALAIDAARRFHRARGADGVLVPAGALVVLAVPPFWDFATSGLESGLVFLWLAAIVRLLVALRAEARGRQLATAIVFGLGPLVRPDLGLASAVFLVAGWRITRPPRRRAIALGAAAIALPLAYEVFRAGYYGTLVPLPALAKSAAGASWGQGALYLLDLIGAYALVVPAGLLVVLRARPEGARERDVVLAPIVAAAAMALFIVRVGGDFMHARLLLPAVFLALAPVMVVPVRGTRWPIIALAVWAIACAILRGDGDDHHLVPHVHDERVAYVRHTHDDHPIDPAVFVASEEAGAAMVADALRAGRRQMISEWGGAWPMNPARPGPIAFVVGRLGTGGVVAPLDGIVGDTLGLANPIGARIPPTGTGGVGHAKQLPWVWELADFADPAIDATVPEGRSIAAARRAMGCGRLAEMLDAARAPLTWGRFWDNLTGAIGRTTLEIPSDPEEAERVFCGARDAR